MAKAIKEKDEQVIIEVPQEQAKAALKVLLSERDERMALLYQKFDEYNDFYFGGQLQTPLITIVKMNNRTLGRRWRGADAMGITSHIEFNENFVALNTEDRVLQTLRHEMIHSWQDEVLYIPDGEEVPKKFQKPTLKDGVITYTEAEQKKRLHEWHNNDFREMAVVVGIPAEGAQCTGNPAVMPKPQSYNRKFSCACETSNGHLLTIWSTRDIFATCDDCGEPFEEGRKLNPEAITIMPKISHIERAGENAVQSSMAELYPEFVSFETKGERKDFLASGAIAGSFETGAYQKKHNAYIRGMRYWVAYTASEEQPEVKSKAAKPKKQPKPKEPVAAIESPTLPVLPEIEEVEVIVQETELTHITVEVSLKSDGTETASEELTLDPNRVWNIDDPQDLLDAHKIMKVGRKAAELFGVNQSTFVRRAAKYGIDLKNGTINPQ